MKKPGMFDVIKKRALGLNARLDPCVRNAAAYQHRLRFYFDRFVVSPLYLFTQEKASASLKTDAKY